jgi:hypothetical protein
MIMKLKTTIALSLIAIALASITTLSPSSATAEGRKKAALSAACLKNKGAANCAKTKKVKKSVKPNKTDAITKKNAPKKLAPDNQEMRPPPPSADAILLHYECAYEFERTPGTSGDEVFAEGAVRLKRCSTGESGFAWVDENATECAPGSLIRGIKIGAAHNLLLYAEIASETRTPKVCSLGYQVFNNGETSNSLVAGNFWPPGGCMAASTFDRSLPPMLLGAMGRGAADQRGHRSFCYLSISQQ